MFSYVKECNVGGVKTSRKTGRGKEGEVTIRKVIEEKVD